MTKRKQVKNACGILYLCVRHSLSSSSSFLVNCQRACKKCDDSRPCERCRKYGLEDSCRDSARKERKKGGRRGPYSRLVEDGDSDESDVASSSRWSEDNKPDSRPSSSLPFSFRLKFDQDKTPSKGQQAQGGYWNVAGTGHGDARPVRSARQRNIRYDEESIFEQRTTPSPRPVLHVGAPDATYIKALGQVCTETLRKLEEEDMPPAVVYQEWPPQVDRHFAPVCFPEAIRPVSPAQPIPQQRRPIPMMMMLDTTMMSSSDSLGSPTTGYFDSSSPVGEASIQPPEMITPPETPVSLPQEAPLKKENVINLPALKGLTGILNPPLAIDPNHQP